MKGLLFLLLAASASAQSTTTVRLAFIEPTAPHATIAMDLVLEQVLAQRASSASLVEAFTVPCYYADGDFRFRLPRPAGAPEEREGTLLELGSEAALVYPAAPSLVEALRHAARDPATFRMPRSLTFASRPTTVSIVPGPLGETLVTAQIDPKRGEAARWGNTVVNAYRLRWEGAEVTVALIGRVFGGLGRLATALERERGGPPLLGLARGGIFTAEPGGLQGRAMVDALAGLGLRFSGADAEEIKRWKEIEAYRFERPDGVRFLSANLVLSSAPTQTLLEPYALLERGGLRLAITAVTDPAASKYLYEAGLAHAKVEDPAAALEPLVRRLREAADVVILLVGVDDMQLLRRLQRFPGIDIVVGSYGGSFDHADAPIEARASQKARRPFAPPLWTMDSWHAALSLLELTLTRRADAADWELRQRHVLLDESVPSKQGYPDLDPEAFGVTASTGPVLIPAARRVFPQGKPNAEIAAIDSHDLWTMSAGLLAETLGAEAGLLRVRGMSANVNDDVKEGVVRVWLKGPLPALTVKVSGARLKELIREWREQVEREKKFLPPSGVIHYMIGGLGPGDTIHGVAIENGSFYRLATSLPDAEALGLSDDRQPDPRRRTVEEVVVAALTERADSPPERYRAWMEGRPVRETGVWLVNFRDVGVNISNTKIVRDDAFDAVPNSRIQGFDERLVGFVFKTDVEYLKGPYKWTNTAEAEYARTRIQPRNQPALTNTTANRIMLLTMGTRRAGGIKTEWLARSWGPSVGLQYDGQFEAPPGLKRKTVYSVFPGIEFYDGSWVRSLKIAGNIKRDFSTEPASTQTGLHFRTVVSREIGPKKVSLNGELWSNYFFLKKNDRPQDLRVEGDANLKLRIPITRHLMVAPFVDFYFFQLKIRPLWGYSAMTGITIGFSRLWKPQYERF